MKSSMSLMSMFFQSEGRIDSNILKRFGSRLEKVRVLMPKLQ